MNLRGFSWREGYLWGKVVGYAGAGSESPIVPPDFNDGPLDTDAVDGFDQFGWQPDGDRFRHRPAMLVKHERVSVLRNSLGRNRWHLVLAEGICDRDSYHDGAWIGPHIGETVAFELPEGRRATINLMDEAPIDARVKSPCVLISHFWAENYAHTLLETCSRFWYLDKHPDLAKLPVVWDLNKPWQKEIADWFVPGQVKSLPHNHVFFDELYVPSFYSNVGMSQDQIRFLRRKFGAPDKPGKRRIFVSRADATERRVENENEVIDTLKAFGFETVMLTGMTVAEQRDLFREAEIVVMPHGAGCANMLFCGSGTKIIEFVPESYQHPMYWHIAKWSGHWYGRITCPDGANKDMRVNVETLKRAIVSAGL